MSQEDLLRIFVKNLSRIISSVTIRDVAKETGVSVATVSRYINRAVRVSDSVGERIEIAIRNLEYVPHAVARFLAARKTRSRFMEGKKSSLSSVPFTKKTLNGGR